MPYRSRTIDVALVSATFARHDVGVSGETVAWVIDEAVRVGVSVGHAQTILAADPAHVSCLSAAILIIASTAILYIRTLQIKEFKAHP